MKKYRVIKTMGTNNHFYYGGNTTDVPLGAILEEDLNYNHNKCRHSDVICRTTRGSFQFVKGEVIEINSTQSFEL